MRPTAPINRTTRQRRKLIRQQHSCYTCTASLDSPSVSQPAQLRSASLPPSPPVAVSESTALFTRDFLLVCLSTFLFSGSMFLLFAVLPLFIVEQLHGAESQVGMIMGAFAVSAVLSRPLSGRLVDTWSRKSCLTLGAFIYVIFPALYTQAASVPVMAALRFFHGIGIAIYTTAGSVFVADLAPPARRGEAMGYYGMALNLAMAIGPALGVILTGRLGFTGPFLDVSQPRVGGLVVGATGS